MGSICSVHGSEGRSKPHRGLSSGRDLHYRTVCAVPPLALRGTTVRISTFNIADPAGAVPGIERMGFNRRAPPRLSHPIMVLNEGRQKSPSGRSRAPGTQLTVIGEEWETTEKSPGYPPVGAAREQKTAWAPETENRSPYRLGRGRAPGTRKSDTEYTLYSSEDYRNGNEGVTTENFPPTSCYGSPPRDRKPLGAARDRKSGPIQGAVKTCTRHAKIRFGTHPVFRWTRIRHRAWPCRDERLRRYRDAGGGRIPPEDNPFGFRDSRGQGHRARRARI